MKRAILISCILTLFISCNKKANRRSAEADALLVELQNVATHGFMFGHHDDPVYGVGWWGDTARSDVKSVCSDYPAVFSFDLGDIEHGSDVNLDNVPFAAIRAKIIEHHLRGGIITLSWHADNPATGGDSWDVSDTAVVASILPEGQNHAKFLAWLNNLTTFFNSCTTPDGAKIPIIFRPYHENSGSWFWWGAKLCTAEQYKTLWRMTRDYLMQNGVNQLLYAYSPQDITDEANYLERYAGDRYVDILGCDQYMFGNRDEYIAKVNADLTAITALGKARNKPVAFTETGYEAIPDSLWWTETLLPLVKKYPISYLVVWRNACEQPNHFYAPFPGQISAPDFVKFYEDERTVFLRDMKQ
ncbi:MAG: glycoside hydrolase family 26 protein [Prevotellaceae bacterium]|jgi:mannan endo-1,4-beta-mannosidase|nr:glycoside hydrolase family 26 protein [Prevotellaceae bacterium]